MVGGADEIGLMETNGSVDCLKVLPTYGTTSGMEEFIVNGFTNYSTIDIVA